MKAQQSLNNPMAMLQLMGANNPNIQNALQIMQQYGNGDPRAAFYAYAQQKGLNPNQVLEQAKQQYSSFLNSLK